MNKRLLLLCLTLCVILLQGCAGKKSSSALNQDVAAGQEYEETYGEGEGNGPYPDHLEGFNRGVFSFNDGFITYVFTPIDTVYTGFFPPDIRTGFGNFYRNLGYPVRLINALLQFKFDKMAKETASFALNTFFGVGGLFNITHNMPSLQSSPEDFSQTLAFYGLDSGTYLVLPILGPTTLRDAVGSVADSFAHPLSFVTPDSAKYALIGHDRANSASAKLPAYKSIKEESFDHYTSMKDVYFQYRLGLEKE
ncbi:phospholipid-binding lipoprotein MlaA [Desulfomicrobium macestii]|uniref:Phospholipid-binding lipoprotein MlaA n=2 Tax=Desulfomicrobium TaxID=898 RepID=A0A8G2C5E4_DESNO|nr:MULTISPECIES: VacJ family lipoprotein [Desulfomicrobium]MBE1424775.1 phospholipid-binding lipoprotein MlaA [Desulfomicrobium macestii]SFM10535.1 phospholipid-binding lipoprotein MlaA [Desulfomicrobium norvegicum]